MAEEMMSSYTENLSEEKKKFTKLTLELQKANSDLKTALETHEDKVKLAVSQAASTATNQLKADFDLKNKRCMNKINTSAQH